MQIDGHDIGVCSWSLQPTDLSDTVKKVCQLGLGHLQLSLVPWVGLDEAQIDQHVGVMRQSGLTLTAGMIGFPGENYRSIPLIRESGGFIPDALWPQRKEATITAARIAVKLGIKQISVHVGFIPPSSHDHYRTMIHRVCEVAAPLAELGIDLLMETGQESASELLKFINDLACRNTHVNFDPANMILYGAGDPIDAVRILNRHIRHVHVKDAILSDKPGSNWGTEVPFGTGHVGAKAFLAALKAVGYTGPLVIEREAGNNRMADVQTAIESLRKAV